MGLVFKFVPYLAFPALVLISAVVGLHLILTSQEVLLERYERLVYNLTNEHPEDFNGGNQRTIVLYGRILGATSLVFSLAMAGLTYYYFFCRA